MLKEFKKFLLRGNVIDLAVGVVIGAAFNSVVTSLTTDFLNPIISVFTKGPNLNGLSFGVDGIEFTYGHFINSLISFVLVAATVFFFVVKPNREARIPIAGTHTTQQPSTIFLF